MVSVQFPGILCNLKKSNYENGLQFPHVCCDHNYDKFIGKVRWVLVVLAIHFISGEWNVCCGQLVAYLIQFIVFQVVFAVSWPIPYKNPMRKLFFNIGFQFNYMEPFRLSSFYNATYFQNPFDNRELKSNEFESKEPENVVETSTLAASNNAGISTEVGSFDGVNQTSRVPKSVNVRIREDRYPFESTNHNNELIGRDLTAAQLYEGIEEHLSK